MGQYEKWKREKNMQKNLERGAQIQREQICWSEGEAEELFAFAQLHTRTHGTLSFSSVGVLLYPKHIFMFTIALNTLKKLTSERKFLSNTKEKI